MPRLACWSCGRSIYATSPLAVALRRGAPLPALRRAHEHRAPRRRAPRAGPSRQPTRRPWAPARRRAPREGASIRPAAPRPVASMVPRVVSPSRDATMPMHVDVPRAGPDRRLRRPRAARGRGLGDRRLEPDGGRAGAARSRRASSRSAPATLEDALAGADLVVLAAPPTACLALLDRLAGRARRALPAGAVVTDVASTKALIVAARRDRLGLRFVGGHPMAGRETSGFGAATRRSSRDGPGSSCPAIRQTAPRSSGSRGWRGPPARTRSGWTRLRTTPRSP